jgi:hypothetical protein
MAQLDCLALLRGGAGPLASLDRIGLPSGNTSQLTQTGSGFAELLVGAEQSNYFVTPRHAGNRAVTPHFWGR